MYHGVSRAASRRFRSFVVEPAQFEEQMEQIASSGCRSHTISELVSRDEASTTAAGRPVAITFDDAFQELAEHAFPVLERLGLTATVYVPTAYIGATSAWLEQIGEGSRRILSADEMAAVSPAVVEFGAHSHTHRALDTLPLDEVRKEVTISKRTLEEALGRPASTFAYPFGYERTSTRALVREAGYSSACAVGYRHSRATDDVYALPRVPVYAGTDLRSFELLLGSDARLRSRRMVSRAWRSTRRVTARGENGWS
jgi:peptidoglycan/xylan/chitin deacetylase (PgdA/CDA1 family)